MKDLIFEYLKKFNIQFDEYINSKVNELPRNLKSPNEVEPHLPIKVKIEREKEKCQIYITSIPEQGKKYIFDELTDGLIQLINEKTKHAVIQSVVPGWYGWQSEDLSIDFGIKNETFGFIARFAV